MFSAAGIHRVLMFGALCCASLVFSASSCSDSEGDDNPPPPPGGGSTEEPISPGGGKQDGLSIAEQKSQIEHAGQGFINEFQSFSVQDLKGVAAYVGGDLVDDYDTTPLEQWYKDALDVVTNLIDSENYGDYAWNEYERLLSFSRLTGHWTASNGRWTKTNANDLQFSFPYAGQTVVATLSKSGKEKLVYAGEDYDYDYGYDAWGNWHGVEDYYNVYVKVPERLDVSIKLGGNTLAAVSYNADLTNVTDKEFNLSRDKFSATARITVKDVTIDVSQLAYNVNKTSAAGASLKKGNKVLLSAEASLADLSIVEEADEYYPEYSDWAVSTAGAANVKLNVMGEVQVKGNVADLKQTLDLMDQAAEHADNESAFKSYVQQINNKVDLGVYYNGGTQKQASVVFVPVAYGGGWGQPYYDCELALKFSDGSTYSIDSFFDESSFGSLYNQLEALLRKLTAQ